MLTSFSEYIVVSHPATVFLWSWGATWTGRRRARMNERPVQIILDCSKIENVRNRLTYENENNKTQHKKVLEKTPKFQNSLLCSPFESNFPTWSRKCKCNFLMISWEYYLPCNADFHAIFCGRPVVGWSCWPIWREIWI